MLRDDIKSARDKARKEKNTFEVTLFSTLLGEFERKGKDVDDSTSVSILKKYILANQELGTEDAESENDILFKYLPVQLTGKEIEDIVYSLPDRSIGVVMKHFKENYSGRYDAKLLSEILRG